MIENGVFRPENFSSANEYRWEHLQTQIGQVELFFEGNHTMLGSLAKVFDRLIKHHRNVG